MEKWLMGCGATTSGVYRVFDHESSIAVVYFLLYRVRFARTAKAQNFLADLHEARQWGKYQTRFTAIVGF
jgi:hypothetical protein